MRIGSMIGRGRVRLRQPSWNAALECGGAAVAASVSALGQGQAGGLAAQRRPRGLGLDGRAHTDPAQAPWAVGRTAVQRHLGAPPSAAAALRHTQAARLSATGAGDLVEVDTLDVRPLPGMVFKHFTARDVIPRWDVIEVRSRATATTAAALLETVVARMPFAVRAIQVDGGSEFHAAGLHPENPNCAEDSAYPAAPDHSAQGASASVWPAARRDLIEFTVDRSPHKQGKLLLVAGLTDSFVAATLLAHSAEAAGLFAAATVLMVVGLVDDRHSLRPASKLAGEILAGIIAVAAGCRIDTVARIDLGWLGPTATVFWIVAIINAVNMVDGVDGLAAGIGLIISATLFSISLYLGNIESSLILAALGGALLGFLWYNFYPARIFLGDSGSLLLGFLLAVSAIQSSGKAATVSAIMWPLLALGLPLAELALTTLRRTLRVVRVVRLDIRTQRYEFCSFGSAALFTADRDHIHHRLLAAGLTHSRVLAILYGVCVLSGVGSFLLVLNHHDANVLLLLVAFGLAAQAVRQLDYLELQPFKNGLLLPLFDLPAVNRRVVCVLFDLGFISLSYLAAWAILLNTFSRASLAPLLTTIPLLAAVKIGCFMLAGLYRRAYRYAGITDLFALGNAIALATTGGWIVLFTVGYGRCPAPSFVVLDAYLLATLLLGSRVSFRLLDHVFNVSRPSTWRVLIYGAGSGGVAALQEIRSNPALGMRPVGFVDDDPRKQGQMLQGVRVYQPAELATLIEQWKTDAVIVATRKLPAEALGKLTRLCTDAGIMLRFFQITLGELERVAQISPNANAAAEVAAPTVPLSI